MVLNNLHYQPGVLAKESSQLSIASGGGLELAIGAGDWPDSSAGAPPSIGGVTAMMAG